MTRAASIRSMAWGAAVAAVLGLGIWAAPGVCSLLLASFIVAYVCAPAVDFMQRRRLRRPAGAVLVLLGIALFWIGLFLLLVPVVVEQGRNLSVRLPKAVAYLEGTLIPWFETRFGVDIPDTTSGLADRLRELLPRVGSSLATPLGQLLATTFGGVVGILAALANLLLLPILAFDLLVNYHAIWPRIAGLVPRRHETRVRDIMRRIDASLAGFVRGQLTVALVLGVMIAIGLSIVGIDGAIVIGLLSGLLNLVPYVGTAVGVGLSLLLAVFEFSGWGPIVGVAIVFVVTQTLEGLLITPRIVGDRTGLSPVAVILAVMAGGEIFGFVGLLLAVPAAAVLKVLLQVAHQSYVSSDAYGLAAAAPGPPAPGAAPAPASPASPPSATADPPAA